MHKALGCFWCLLCHFCVFNLPIAGKPKWFFFNSLQLIWNKFVRTNEDRNKTTMLLHESTNVTDNVTIQNVWVWMRLCVFCRLCQQSIWIWHFNRLHLEIDKHKHYTIVYTLCVWCYIAFEWNLKYNDWKICNHKLIDVVCVWL